jgi:uncharacterized protein (TIGR02594 family)
LIDVYVNVTKITVLLHEFATVYRIIEAAGDLELAKAELRVPAKTTDGSDLPVDGFVRLRSLAWATSIVIVPLAITIFTQFVVLTNGYFKDRTDNRQYDIKMIEIALGILREDVEESALRPVRGWAVDLLSKYSEQSVADDARQAMLDNRVVFEPFRVGSREDGSGIGVMRLPDKVPADPVLVAELRKKAQATGTERWMALAIDELGVQEVPGPDFNGRIAEYFAAANTDEVDDLTPWSGAFVAFVLKSAGFSGFPPAPLRNRNWAGWGTEVTEPTFGSIAVFWRISPDSEYGHSGFVVDSDEETITIIGGNVRDSVGTSRMSRNRLISIRYPPMR